MARTAFITKSCQLRRSGKRQENVTGFYPICSVRFLSKRGLKNAQEEWSSKTEWHRICVFRPRLAEYVATAIKKGSHVLVEGELVSSSYERPNGKSNKPATTKITSWSIQAGLVRKLDRGEPEPEVHASGPVPSDEAANGSASPF